MKLLKSMKSVFKREQQTAQTMPFPCHPLREGEEEVPQTKPKNEISILAEMSPKKNLEKQSCFPCMGNALKTSLVGFQPHGAEKSPLGALTLGSEPPAQGGIFKGENGAHWRPCKKKVCY